MSVVATLLDKARARKGVATDMALAERLGRSRAVVSEWRSGSSYPDEDMIVHLAEMAGDDPGEWLIAVRAVRADGPAKKAWLALSKRLGAAAMIALCAIGIAGGAAPAHSRGDASQGMHIMFGGWWVRLARLWLGRRAKPQGPYIEARL